MIEQQEHIALVAGQPYLQLPDDLYIPPAALRIFLSAFEGPLDLLLYLIKKHNIDILDIPIAEITRQYMEYIELMKDVEFSLAADYLVMAATLAHIKSRLLLPRTESEEDDAEDPRAELARRLQEYERFKLAAEQLDELPRYERDLHDSRVMLPTYEVDSLPQPTLDEMIAAVQQLMRRATLYEHHQVLQEPLSIRERMSIALNLLQQHDFVEFTKLFNMQEGRLGIVVSFMAVLELLKQNLIEIVQSDNFSTIHMRAK